MRLTKIIVGLFLFILLASEAMAQKITTDFDPRASLGQYKTFMWIRPPKIEMDPLMEPRLMDAINAALTAKGWQLVTEGADVGLVAHVATRERHIWKRSMTDLAEAGAGTIGASVSAKPIRRTTPTRSERWWWICLIRTPNS